MRFGCFVVFGLIKEMKNFVLIVKRNKMENKEILEEVAGIEIIAMDKLKNKWGHLYTFGYPQRPFPTNYENDLNNIKIGLYEGKKWQAERMYSEEEVLKLLLDSEEYTSRFNGRTDLKKWFKFKKK
jgi:hypothetical protein